MRNLKKLLAVIVSVCVLATFTFPAFAAEKTAAEICEDLGVLKGDSSEGVTDTYLAKGTTRDQAAILYLRLIGKEDEAYAFEGEDNFADADKTWDNAKKALAYLKANPELGWQGVSADLFDPKAPISAQQMYKVCLEALGYKQGVDFEWADVFTFAAEKGLKLIADVTEMTNNDVAIALVEALKVTMKDSTTTLIEDLVAKGVVTEAAAIAAGLIEPEPEELEVVSVEADNLVRVVVTFNKAIDDDSIDNGDFEVDGTDVTSANVSLSDDKKVATLKLTTALSNGDEIEIVISGIKDADGKELEDYEGVFTPMDVKQPQVESIEFVGPETAKITFSEPLEESGSAGAEVIIDGGIYSATPAAGFDNGTEVTVDLGTELDEGAHTFKIKGFEDFAGYSNIVKTIDVEYAAVDSAPSVTIKKATQSYVVLKFERPVKDIELDDFYQSYGTWKPLEIQNEDGDTEITGDTGAFYDVIRLVFTDAESVTKTLSDDDDKPLPVGTAKVVVKDGSVEDRWGNEIDGDVILTATITADDVKPEVTKISVESEDQIFVYFSESVVAADAEDDGNYVIKDKDGKVISSSKWDAENYNTDDNYVEINFHSKLDNGDYTITIEAIADTSISANTLDTVTLKFTITDKTADLSGVEADWVDAAKVLYVKYNDTMDSASVLDKANYRLDGAELASSVKLTMFTSKIVKMQFASGTADIEGSVLTIGRVKDAAGNVVSALATPVTITDEDAPEITAVKKIADNKFELTVDQELKSISSGAIKVDADGADALTAANASYKFVNDGADTKITITVPSAHKHAGTEAVTATYQIIIAADSIKSVTGVPVAGVTITAGGALGEFEDGVAPTFATDDEDDKVVYAYDTDGNDKIDHFIVKYSEDINAGTVSKYTYVVDGYKVTSAIVVEEATIAAVMEGIDDDDLTPGDGAYVVITVNELDDEDIDQTPDVTQKYAIEDLAGNELEPQKAVEAISVAEALTRDPEA